MMNYGTFEASPAVWNDAGEAWVLLGGEWRQLHIAEIMSGARPMAEAEWKRSYADLPPMPKAAFQAGE